VYHVYPRSLADADGDGVGDLAGITGRLDYLVDLGVDAVWLSPFYVSPMVDFGYDVADHCAVDPVFGTLADFDELLAAAHARGLRVLIDYVASHTSDQHPWFVDSRRAAAASGATGMSGRIRPSTEGRRTIGCRRFRPVGRRGRATRRHRIGARTRC
jgi:alpha-glucosidase